MSVASAAKLLTDPHSCEMSERHEHALQRVIELNTSGFLMSELSDLSQLIQACYSTIDSLPKMKELLIQIVKLCAFPFWKEKASDEKNYTQQAAKCIQSMGKLLDLTHPDVCITVCNTIQDIYRAEDSVCESADYSKPNRKQLRSPVRRDIVERSHIAKQIGLLLAEDLSSTSQLFSCVLEVLSTLSGSVSGTESILSAATGGRLPLLMLELIDWGRGNQAPGTAIEFTQAMEILWNLLENGSRHAIQSQLSTMDCVDSLHQCLLKLLSYDVSTRHPSPHTLSTSTRELRNDMVVLLSLHVQHCPNAPYVETGLLQTLIMLCSSPEIPEQPTTGAVRFVPDNSHEDFELKKLLLNILHSFLDIPAAILLLSHLPLLPSLLYYVTPVQPVSSGTGRSANRLAWSSEQWEEIQLQSLSVLSHIAGKLPEQYHACQGNARLLSMLDWCLCEDDHMSYGTSVLSQPGCRGSKRAQLFLSLRALLNVSSHQQEQLNQELLDLGVLSLLISFLDAMDPTSTDSLDIDTMSDTLLLISLLCDSDERANELLGNIGGIQVLTNYLLISDNLFSAGLGHHKLFLHALDAIWTCVVGCSANEELFLMQEGVFVLVDCLLTHPISMKSVILGVLVDLSDDARCIPHLQAWQAREGGKQKLDPLQIGAESISDTLHLSSKSLGRNNETAVGVWSLLAELWRREEAALTVDRKEGIIIADVNEALTTGLQREMTAQSSFERTHASLCVMDVADNMRAKIYSLCSRLDFRAVPDSISVEDRATIVLIERYMDIKTGEIWREIASELESEGTRPVAYDREGLAEILNVHKIKCEQVMKMQTDIFEMRSQESLREEQYYYQTIHSDHLMEQMKQAERDEYLERTSNYIALRDAKERQRAKISASRPEREFVAKDIYHGTGMDNLSTTVFCGRSVKIESSRPMRLQPLSPANDTSSVESV